MNRRKLLLLIELTVREHGKAPSWTELQAALGAGRFKIFALMSSLERDSLVTFEDGVPGSARVTAAGLRAAVGK
jgi:hypothetical protein